LKQAGAGSSAGAETRAAAHRKSDFFRAKNHHFGAEVPGGSNCFETVSIGEAEASR
jgi:hypothetical protein